jgi:hypothetical protein
MTRRITKIIYWKDETNEYEDNLYYIQVEYNNKYCEVSLITEDEFKEIKTKYGNLIEKAD